MSHQTDEEALGFVTDVDAGHEPDADAVSEPEVETPELPEGDRRPLASVFDRLIESNIELTTSVGKLVRLTQGVLAFNAVLVAGIIVMLCVR